jgi:hypothetical protein
MFGPARPTDSQMCMGQPSCVKEFDEPAYYQLQVPVYEKKGCIRSTSQMQCRLPHECVSDDHERDPERAREFAGECPTFLSSDTARKCLAAGYDAADIVPLSLYFDGVQYTKMDSFVGYYAENLYTRRKYLLAAISACLSCL